MNTILKKNELEKLYESYFPKVYKYFRFRVRNRQLSDDLTSAVFLKVIENFVNYSPDKSSFSTWIFTIARNTLIDYYRSSSRNNQVSMENINSAEDLDADQECNLIKSEEKNALLAAVAELGDREKEILALKFSAGFTNVEIARMTGLSESNVGVILFRAVSRLRKILSDAL